MMEPRKSIKKIYPHIRGKQIAEVEKEYDIDEVYQLSANENPLGASLSAIEAGKVAIFKGSLYPDDNCTDLRLGLSESLGIDPKEIIFGNGSDEILKNLSLAYLNPGDEIIAPDPCVGDYVRAAMLCDAKIKLIPLHEEQIIDLPAMVSAIGSKTKMLYIANPNNPTGAVIQKRLFLQMLHRIGSDVLVVLDETYFEYMDALDTPNGMNFFKEFPNLVVLRTFSKAYGLAGLRIGYAVCSKTIAAEVNRVSGPFHINSVAQAAALAALFDKEHLKKSIHFNKVERDYLQLSLKTLGFKALPSEANFILIDVGIHSKKVVAFLESKGIIVLGADIFGYPHAIRVSIGLRKENEKLLDALKILRYKEQKAKSELK